MFGLFKKTAVVDNSEANKQMKEFDTKLFQDPDAWLIDQKIIDAIHNFEYAQMDENTMCKIDKEDDCIIIFFKNNLNEFSYKYTIEDIGFLLACLVAVKDGFARSYHITNKDGYSMEITYSAGGNYIICMKDKDSQTQIRLGGEKHSFKIFEYCIVNCMLRNNFTSNSNSSE